MNSIEIDYFLTVAKYGSVSRAANKLNISQPAVSRQIRLLEEETGIKLFQREGRGVVLTECGEALEKIFLECKEKVQNTLEAYHSNEKLLSGNLRIGHPNTWDFIPQSAKIIQRIKEEHPLVNISFHSDTHYNITEGLKWKALDAIITLQPDLIALPNATFESILKIDRMILYSDHLPLEHRNGELQPIDFKDVTFYVPAEMEAPFMQQNIHDLCVENGFSPKEEVVASWQTAMANVYNGKGVVVADSWTPTAAQPYFKKVYFKQQHEVFFGYRSANADKRIPVLKQEIKKALNDH